MLVHSENATETPQKCDLATGAKFFQPWEHMVRESDNNGVVSSARHYAASW